MRRAVLIVNPFASEVTPARVAAVEAELRRVAAVETRATEGPGHATELVRGSDEVDAFFVFSGDGGFNEALNGAADSVPLGFVPGGGASVLPRLLGLPRDPVRAAARLGEALAAGRTRRISLGRVNGRRFAFAAGLGLDAELVRRIDRRGRSPEGRRAGNLTFVWELMRLVAERRGRLEPVLELEGLGRAAFALVPKADPFTYAGLVPFRVSRARLEGGLDVAAPVSVTPLRIPALLLAFLRGRGGRGILRGHDLDRIVARCDRPLALQADGEDLGDVSEALFEAERGAVSVLV